ncbi:hypothetical protein [Zavarzinia sp. CC-PAN008]|uniref:hypothetical protein n=1 Tax=Zavarzinia sp. CC-PAN008 TaxID=3243332 RepID=UPI003F74490D
MRGDPPTDARIIAAARTWLGTPWRHQARTKGVGVDCANLVIGVGLEVGTLSPDRMEPLLARYGAYPRQPVPGRMIAALRSFLVEVERPAGTLLPADLPWMDWGGLPCHLGIATILADGRPGLLHAFAPARRVVEHGLSADIHARVRAVFRLPQPPI